MRNRWRFCRQRAARLLGGLGLVLVLQLAPQVSLAATELACECEAIEVVNSGSARRSLLNRDVSEDAVSAATSHVRSAGPTVSADAITTRPAGHLLPNGSRAPLRC